MLQNINRVLGLKKIEGRWFSGIMIVLDTTIRQAGRTIMADTLMLSKKYLFNHD